MSAMIVSTRRLGAATATLALLVAAGCGGDDDSASGDGLDLDDTTLLSTAVEGQTLVEGTHVSLSFEGDNLAVVAGCNTMVGGYEIDGELLVAEQLASTQMLCDEALSAQDAWLQELFTSRPTIAAVGDDVVVTGETTTITFGSRERIATAHSLDGGTWAMESLDGQGGPLSAPEGAYVTITSDSIFVSTGCNRGSGTLEVGDGVVTIGAIASTMMACEGELQAWEAAVFGLLQGELSYEVDDDELTLTNDATTLTLEAIPAD